MPRLSEKQKRFILEYLIDYNGTQAAIRAGYNAKNARQQASDLLTKPYIQEAINKKQEKLEIKLDISAEKIRYELAKIAFSNIFDLVDINGRIRPEVTRESLSAISKYRFKEGNETGKLIISFDVILHDKFKALELLARMMGYCDKKCYDSDSNQTGVVFLPWVKLEAVEG